MGSPPEDTSCGDPSCGDPSCEHLSCGNLSCGVLSCGTLLWGLLLWDPPVGTPPVEILLWELGLFLATKAPQHRATQVWPSLASAQSNYLPLVSAFDIRIDVWMTCYQTIHSSRVSIPRRCSQSPAYYCYFLSPWGLTWLAPPTCMEVPFKLNVYHLMSDA